VSIRLGGLDWLARYADLVRDADAQSGPRTGDRWRERAARFDRMSRRAGAGDAEIDALLRLVEPGDVVIDVGAGAGRHAVPLASRGAQVIAVEPSDAMRERLAARIADEQIGNLHIRGDAWPIAPPPAADVAYSAHVVYGVAEIGPFLEAMTAAARRRCALLLKLRAPSEAFDELFQVVHGVRRRARPAALEAFAALHQLGHQASLDVLEDSARALVFRDEEDDLREVALRLGLGSGEAGRARAREALARTCPRGDDGWIVGDAGPSAMVTWVGRGG
jgi:SAM-dependent methyltransferase